MIKVSVIMACHNAELYLHESIKSVIDQTYTNLELIIVDDASKDNSLEIAKSYEKQDTRIKVYQFQENRGAGCARNYAISKAVGDWLAILDADDVFLSKKLELQVQKISEAGPDLILVGTDSFEIDNEGNRFSMQKYPAKSQQLKNNLIRQKRFPPHSSLMYRTDVVQKLGGYDNRLCPSEDYNLWLHLTSFGSFVSVPEPLVEYRHHLKNISKVNSGFEQLKYGYAAAICYYLRIQNYADPIHHRSTDEWESFIAWLSRRLQEMSILAYKHKKEEYRNIFFSRNGKIARTFRILFRSFFDPVFVYQFISEKIYGTLLPKELASEWIKKSDESDSNRII